MNERIKELAYEAEDYADSIVDQGGEFHPAYTKKFAELIVRECADINFRHKIGLSSDQDYDVRTTIKEHFGVEE